MKNAPWEKFLGEFEDFAARSSGTDEAVKAWVWCMQLAPQTNRPQVAAKALDVIERDYLKSAAIARVPYAAQHAYGVIGVARKEAFLRGLIAQSPHHAVQGSALFVLAQLLIQPPEFSGDESAPPLSPEERAKRKTEGRALLERVIREFSDAPGPVEGVAKDYVKQTAESILFELDHLQIGMTAPDFEATDENGVKWKLDDYRGKVVVLDFWGFW
jgi:hypothetical protein